MLNVKLQIRQFYLFVRFGKINQKITASAGGGITSEIEFTGRNGKVIGYWAYGSFDPSMPYQG